MELSSAMDAKPIELEDRALIAQRLLAFGPKTSELTFTNLFIWRHHFGTAWGLLGDHLGILLPKLGPSALEPIGPPPRIEACRRLLDLLGPGGRLIRVGRDLCDELCAAGAPIEALPMRDHFDYVYTARDLCELRGKRYHAKRNHLNRFTTPYRFAPLDRGNAAACLRLAEEWCAIHACAEDMSLSGELEAVRELLAHFEELGLLGGVIEIDGRIRAFTAAEALNADTAVVHVEKADPSFPELFAVVNQAFAAQALSGFTFVNREQDLGVLGLRRAKLSYQPVRLEEKFEVRRTRAW